MPTQARRLLSRWKSFSAALFQPVDVASLVAFRIAFGLLMIWQVSSYVQHDWIFDQFIGPDYLFTYYGFEWLQPWPGHGMIIHFALMGVLGLAIAVGFCYRLSMALFCLGFLYVFLLDQTYYLNHFYLIALVSGLMVVVPAHRGLSLDARWWPSLRQSTVPAWTIWLLRFQIGVPYFYGGIAKLNGDWLAGEPMHTWLVANADFPWIGRFFHEPWMALAFSYGGLLFDLLIVPMLLWKKTRWLAFTLATAFHVINSQLFSIGVFPWFMIAATTLFLSPSWPRSLGLTARRAGPRHEGQPLRTPSPVLRRIGIVTASVYIAAQLLIPLRHWVYPGDVNWTNEGDGFSWRMKLNERVGYATFSVHGPGSSEHRNVDPREYLTGPQYYEMCHRPDMLLQFAHQLARLFSTQDGHQPEVYAEAWLSLNGRAHQRLIDRNVNLAEVQRSPRPASWILRLEDWQQIPPNQTQSKFSPSSPPSG